MKNYKLLNSTIGFVIFALSKHIHYADKKFSKTFEIIEKCIYYNQIFIYFDKFRNFSGVTFWAKLSKNTSDRLLRTGIENLKAHEIQSGDETWIIELCAAHGSLHQLLRHLRDEYLRESPQVTYFRSKNGRKIAKRISRTDCSSFFQSPTPATKDDGSFIKSHKGAGLRHAAEIAELTAQTLGEVAMLAHHIPEIGNLPFPNAMERLVRPCNLHQYRLYRNTDGQLIGYVSWAWLDSYFASPNIPAPQTLAPHQWNEGPILLICDAFATHLGLAVVCADLITGLFPGETMHMRRDAEYGGTLQANPITNETIENLNILAADSDSIVINILDLLRTMPTQANGVST